MKIIWLQKEGELSRDWEHLSESGKMKATSRVRVRRRKTDISKVGSSKSARRAPTTDKSGKKAKKTRSKRSSSHRAQPIPVVDELQLPKLVSFAEFTKQMGLQGVASSVNGTVESRDNSVVNDDDQLADTTQDNNKNDENEQTNTNTTDAKPDVNNNNNSDDDNDVNDTVDNGSDHTADNDVDKQTGVNQDDDDDDDDDGSHPQPTQTQSAPVILTKDNVSEKENSSEENSGEENSGEAVQEGADDDDASSTSQTKQQITTAARDSSSSRSRSSSSSNIDTDIQQSENNTSANGNSKDDVSAAPQQRVPASPSVITEPSPSVAALRARAVDSIRRASNNDTSSSKRPTMQSSPSRGKAMTLATPKLNMSTGRINVIGHAGGGGVSELREVLADFARGGVLPMDASHAAPRVDERPSWACAALVGGSLRACAAGSGGFDTVTAALRLRALPAAQADAVMLLLRVGLHGSYGAMHKVVLVELIPTHIKRIKRARLQPNRIAARNLFGHFNAVLELTNEHDLVEDTFKKLVTEKLA